MKNNPSDLTYYEVLGITPTATLNEVKQAYRDAAKRCHPDLGGDPAEMLQINEAYGVLKDESLRRDYDIHLTEIATGFEPASYDEAEQHATTPGERAAFFAHVEQVRYAVLGEYRSLRSATVRSLKIYAGLAAASFIAMTVLVFIALQNNADLTRLSIITAPFALLALFALYVVLWQTLPLLVRPYQFIYESAMVDEHISYLDKDLVGAVLADMIDTKRKQRVERLRSLVPNAVSTLRRMFRSKNLS